MSIVKTENLSKIYNHNNLQVKAIEDITIKVEKGDFLALVGPSGSGKTTLLNLIGGLDRSCEGKIFIEGTDISKLTKTELSELRLRKMGFIFQEYNLIPVLTTIENIEFGLLLQGVNNEERQNRVLKVIEELGLEKLKNRKPGEMSGGQQQRVAVARAIVTEPAIVFADEPTANLDSKTGKDLLELMKELNHKKGITFIFSTHDNMVMNMANRIFFLKDGKIVDEKKGENIV